MGGIKEAWDIVFGEGVFEEMISTVIHILMVVGVIIILLILLSIWRIITKNKIKKAILLISEYPDSEHTCIFLSRINNISKFGKFLAKMGFGFCGLSKGECRTIFNTTIINSNFLDDLQKSDIRKAMLSVGCTGLLAI